MRSIKFLLLCIFSLFCFEMPAHYSLGDISGNLSAPFISESETNPLVEESASAEPFEPLQEEEPPKEFNYWQQFFKMMTILGLLLAVVLTIAWTLRGYLNRRVQQINQNFLIKILEKRTLSAKSQLVLVEVYGKKMLVSDSQAGGVQFLSHFEAQSEPSASEDESIQTQQITFSETLQRKFKEAKIPSFFKNKNN